MKDKVTLEEKEVERYFDPQTGAHFDYQLVCSKINHLRGRDERSEESGPQGE